MKKFLSLVLALVMTMSLVTVAGAADFTDDASVTYTEAVDVISALEIVGGYPDGSFNPKGTLTRGAAAKIICNILVGPKAAAELKAVAAPFADVAADNGYAGFIAYCVNAGIISGYGDGTFGPYNQLTGYAFMKMLLTALGYDQNAEGYVGSNAQVNILLDAKAVVDAEGDEFSLLSGLPASFNPQLAISREEACVLALNALQAQKVSYDEDRTNIKIGDIEIATGLGDADPNGTVLYTVNFSKLTPDYEATNELGLPAVEWTLDGEEIGVYAYEADLVVTNYATEGDLYKLMGKKEAGEWGYEKDNDDDVVVMDGQVAYFYYDETTPYYVETLFGKVVTVVEDDAEDEDDVAYVEIENLFTNDIYYYETDKLAEDDYVIFYEDQYNVYDGDEYEYVAYNVSKPATTDGAITAVKGDEYIKVDGAKEVMSYVALALNNDVEIAPSDDVYTFYYDYAGAIIAVDLKKEAEESYNYVWVMKTDAEVAGSNLLNTKKDVAKVKVLFLDGTVETVDYKISYATKDNTAVVGGTIDKKAPYFVLNGEKYALEAKADFTETIVEGFYAYTKDADGYTFRTISDAKVTGATEDYIDAYTKEAKTMVGDEKTWTLTAKTTFTTVGEDGSVKTKTGYKNIDSIADETLVLVLHAKDSAKATAIYTIVEKESVSETVNYAYFVSAGETNADGNVECTFWVGGKSVTYWTDLGELVPALGEVYDLTVEDKVATLELVVADYAGEITVLDDAYMTVNDKADDATELTEADFAKEYEVYQVSLNEKTLTKGTLAEEKNVSVFLDDDGDIALVLINHSRNAEYKLYEAV